MIDLERIRKATRAIRVHHSLDDVMAVAQEEAGELIAEIAGLRRGKATYDSICREALDCIVVCVSLLDALEVDPETVDAKMLQVEGYRKP